MDAALTPADAVRFLDDLTDIIVGAATATLATPFDSVPRRLKPDQSPVTEADEASEAIIIEGLSGLLPGIQIVAEEDDGRSLPAALGRTIAIVDPLDGTREFLAGRDEFTVNIALVADGVPIAGVIAAPAQGLLWRGVISHGAERLSFHPDTRRADTPVPIRTRKAAPRLVATTSRSHLDERTERLLSKLPLERHEKHGSAVKFCHIAQGDADIYPRLAPTCEWDVAAGQAILVAAGGRVTTAEGAPVVFGRLEERFRIPSFIAWGDASAPAPLPA